jgi:ABC-type microcin C transport system duplicated ATPase subunit YejF
MAPLLDVQNLVKHFPISGSSKVVQALNGVSFTIDKGETLSLVGESGSGKTTVGRCVVGLVPATDGAILFDGEPLDARRNIRHRSVRGRIQFVFQEPNESLDPRIPVGVSLAEPLRHLGVARADRERRVREVAGRIGVTEADLLRYPGELAGGILQRVGIGRAIVTRPDLIVLDEPTSALDRSVQKQIVDLLRDLQAAHDLSYLFISHDLAVVRAMADYIVVMKQGKIVEEGPTEAIFDRPRETYTQELMAAALDQTRFRQSA